MPRPRTAPGAARSVLTRAATALPPASTQIPVPGPDASVVSVVERRSRRPITDVLEGWFPVYLRGMGDYEGVPPPAMAEVYVRVSFAQRRAHSGYCEEVRLENPVAQPMDSYSNALFAVTGLHMLAVGLLDAWKQRARRRAARGAAAKPQLPLAAPGSPSAPPPAQQQHIPPMLSGMERFPIYSIANGLVQFYAGLSSFIFHASMTALGQRLDMAGVYMLVVSPSLYMLLRLGAFGPPGSRWAHACFLAATALAAWALFVYKWRFEGYAHGSTFLVLDLVALMVGLTVRLRLSRG
jgi:hypothetical protein